MTGIANFAFFGCSKLSSVTFEVVTGWKASGGSLEGLISTTDLAGNAKLLTETYLSSYWTRS